MLQMVSNKIRKFIKHVVRKYKNVQNHFNLKVLQGGSSNGKSIKQRLKDGTKVHTEFNDKSMQIHARKNNKKTWNIIKHGYQNETQIKQTSMSKNNARNGCSEKAGSGGGGSYSREDRGGP